MSQSEINFIRQRYERRKTDVEPNRYSFLNASVWQIVHERQRVMLQLFDKLGMVNFKDACLLEVGCGAGDNLLEFLRIGFQPKNLMGIELLEERFARAKIVLPQGIVQLGDAASINIPTETHDIVFQSVVFSSLLDDVFQGELAKKMWGWVKPGGGVLWYDFIYNNPKNPDVRGVSVKQVRNLFPEGEFIVKRVTLAPPIARRVCNIHPGLYTVLNSLFFLRTHILCWIGKK